MSTLFAFLHHVCAFTLVAALAIEFTLIKQELEAAEPADKVIFLGPPSRFYDKVPDASLDQHRTSAPQFFYFQYKPYWGREADFPDSVAMAIRKVKGKTMLIHSPDEFARAIKEVGSEPRAF